MIIFFLQPFLMWETSVLKYSHRRILMLFVPITLVLTPIGQYVGGIAPIPIMKMVAGVVVLMVAFIETYVRRQMILAICKKKETSEEANANATADIKKGITAIVMEEPKDPNAIDKKKPVIPATPTYALTESSPDASDQEGDDLSEHDIEAATVPAPVTQDPTKSNEEASSQMAKPADKVKFGCNRVTSDTVIAGGLSGFLGGMIGIRTPPLMLYFMHPPKPLVFDNHSQRATGVVIMCTSTVFRQVFYLYDTFKGDDVAGYQSDFIGYQKEEWKLYLCVVIFSILGGWVGGRAFEYVKDAKETIQGIFLVLLYMCGASLFISAVTA